MKRLLALIILLSPAVALAQTPGVCPEIMVLLTESQVIAEDLRVVPIVGQLTLLQTRPCPTGSRLEALTNASEQIRSGLVLGGTFNGELVGVPPARIVRFVFTPIDR